MTSIDDPDYMADILNNIVNGTLNSNFKEQFDNLSENFEDYAKMVLGEFFAFVDKYILDIKAKDCYSTTSAEQEEVRRTCLEAFSLLREPTIDNLRDSAIFSFFCPIQYKKAANLILTKLT